MNFAQLKTFQAVAKNGSITGAAQILHISQPAVSKHLKILEEDNGVGARQFQKQAPRHFHDTANRHDKRSEDDAAKLGCRAHDKIDK